MDWWVGVSLPVCTRLCVRVCLCSCVCMHLRVPLCSCNRLCLFMWQSISINRRVLQYPSHKNRPFGGICDIYFALNIAGVLKASSISRIPVAVSLSGSDSILCY